MVAAFLLSSAAFAGPCGSVSMIGAYWVQPPTNPKWGEIAGVLQFGHVELGSVWNASFLDGQSTKAIVDMEWTLWTPSSCVPHPQRRQNLLDLNRTLAGRLDKVAAFYIKDEPYGNGCPRSVVEQAIADTKAVFPSIPAYITFAQWCFDPAYTDNCKVDGSQRGIPAGLDWMSFDWYLCGGGRHCKNKQDDFNAKIVGGVQRALALLQPNQKILLTGDAFTMNNPESELLNIVQYYWDYAVTVPQIIGIDFFLYMNDAPWTGITGMPQLKAKIASFAQSVAQCNAKKR